MITLFSSKQLPFAFNTWVNFHQSLNLAISYFRGAVSQHMEREGGKKNPSEFIIKWNLLNVKQNPAAMEGGPGGQSGVKEELPSGLAALFTGSRIWVPPSFLIYQKMMERHSPICLLL